MKRLFKLLLAAIMVLSMAACSSDEPDTGNNTPDEPEDLYVIDTTSFDDLIAKAQEARARVIEAEAELPRAMAEAFINGNLGIMDYYRMKNIEADTNMRDSIGNPVSGTKSPKESK